MPYLVVGLGNPGSKYALTRHNVGFMVLDHLVQRWRLPEPQKKFKGLLWEANQSSQKVFLLAPQTYMNLSGESMREVTAFYKIEPAKETIVISDDLDLAVGRIRIRASGGAGGHNGLRSIIECLGTETFPRLRIGVGRNPNIAGADFVLGKIGKSEEATYEKAIFRAAEAIEMILEKGLERAMEFFNRKEVNDGA